MSHLETFSLICPECGHEYKDFIIVPCCQDKGGYKSTAATNSDARIDTAIAGILEIIQDIPTGHDKAAMSISEIPAALRGVLEAFREAVETDTVEAVKSGEKV